MSTSLEAHDSSYSVAMGYSDADTARDAHDAGRAEEDLLQAVANAEEIASRFSNEHADADLRPEVAVRLSVGGEDQPVIVFDLLVDLADDLAANSYPIDEIVRLRDKFRERVAQTSVEAWDWIVNTGTRAGAAAG